MPPATWHARDPYSKARLISEAQRLPGNTARCHVQHPQMATSLSATQQRHKPDFNDLSSELLALIFEQLREIDTPSIWTARCLCQRFHDIATPVAYRVLSLNENIVAPEAEQRCPRGLAHIYDHTNHVIASSDLDPVGIARVLGGIRSLASVRWRYVDANLRSNRFWLPSDVLSVQQTQLHKTKLYVEDLPLGDFDGNLQNTYLRAIPTEFLASLKMAPAAPPLTTRLGSLKTLLLRSPQLETFHYRDRGQGTQFMFNGDERLPPFRELKLESYDWHHTQDDVSRHWDFSRLRSLELVSVPVFNFLSSVSFSDLAGLHTLHAEDFSAHLPDRRADATRGLHALIATHIRALRSLDLTCHTALFPAADALLPHAASLRRLRLRDHVGFGDEGRPCPTLAPADLALLGRRLAHLRALELDMDAAVCDPPPFLRALCAGFPRLHTLALHVQTVLRPLEAVGPGVDRDREAVARILDLLVRGREEAAAAAAARDGGGVVVEPWRSVTINVGGWRRLMVRRLGEPWRRQNARGVFAERCFVLEREALSGRMAVREEMAVEVGQRIGLGEIYGVDGWENEGHLA